MNAVFQELGPCACGESACEQIGTKLSKALDEETAPHLVGCRCIRHRNRRNQSKGKRGQAKGHRALGGQGMTPSNEESVGGYDVRCQVEWKTGEQIPASFTKFVSLDWTRRALSQANRARRIGDGSMPTVGIVIGGKTYLVVEANRDMDGVA